MSKKFLSGINVTGTATLNTVADAGSNTGKFLVLDASNNVSYRTAAEMYADLGIGSTAAAYTSTLKHEVKASQTIGKGQAVYVSSADGTNMVVSKASNVSEQLSSKTMGLLETSLVTNGKGNVITEGLLSGLNTSSATAGDPVWLGVDGALIFGLTNKPVAPAHLVFIGIVTRVHTNNGEIFVKVQNGFEMNELHNYQEGSVQNNQVIVYESATSLYKPKSIPTILGYTPADDASVVRITGAQTVGGLKTFSASIIANIGLLLKNNAVSALNGYTAIGGASSNGIELVFSPGGFTQRLLFQPSAAYSYTFPAATGTVALISDIPSLAGYVPNTRTLTINGTTYDLSENRAWTITTDASARSILRYVATANQTTFTISGGYTPGLTDVYRNGVKLDNSTDFTATNGTTIVLTNGASVNDVIEVYRYQTAFLANNALRTVTEFVATAGQTTFNVLYNSGLVDVFYNGSKLVSSEYTAGNGDTIVLNFPCNVNDTLEVHAYSYTVGAFTGQAQLNGTGFVKANGTTITYDNSTYLTTSAAASTYLTTSAAGSTYLPLSGGTLTGPLNGTSAVFSNISIGLGLRLSSNTNEGEIVGTSGRGLRFYTNDGNSNPLNLKTDGNVGFGSTVPNAWNTIFRVIEIGNFNSSIYARNDGFLQLFLGVNQYYSFDGNYKYANAGPASRMYQYEGDFVFQNAISGTAGSTINWSTPMVLTNQGFLGVGTQTPQRKFVVSNGGAEGVEISHGTNFGSIISFNRSLGAWQPLVLQEGTGNVLIGQTSDNGARLQVNGLVSLNSSIISSPNVGSSTIDTSGSFATLVNGAFIDFPSMSGMIIVNNTGTGAVQVFICGGGNTSSLGFVVNNTGSMTHSPGVGGYRFTNNTGSTWIFAFQVFKTRGTA